MVRPCTYQMYQLESGHVSFDTLARNEQTTGVNIVNAMPVTCIHVSYTFPALDGNPQLASVRITGTMDEPAKSDSIHVMGHVMGGIMKRNTIAK